MTVQDLDDFFRSLLDIDGFSSTDRSLNGLQVGNNGDPVQKIAFAVDACLESFRKAAVAGADLIFVHHGLFWGSPLPVTGTHRTRLQFLLDNNIALYAVHLPLDQHPSLGNNAALADMLNLTERQPFGMYHGKALGYWGKLSPALSIDEAAQRIRYLDRPIAGSFPFGVPLNKTCAVISGGASELAHEAIEKNIDLYVTGESLHSIYHYLWEGELNVVAGGHYNTEVWGVRRIMEQCALQLSLAVEFIDVQTGL
ncbi:MAG: Nif3-like dinuclear metal center hexameric protein [Spirochaetaceae bacterium]|jgi:dinuclear metal center YbgI/SA1388 family protein|nr:Nif3-like dinuclear metal center hexameric protein [Spirochaetaceae bacterium]